MPPVVPRVVLAVWMGVLIALSARAQPVPTGPAFDLTGSASGAILPALERAPQGGGIATTLRRTDGTLTGRQMTRARRRGNPPVSVRTTTRFSGVAMDAGRAPEAPAVARGLAPCTDDIRLRCRVGD